MMTNEKYTRDYCKSHNIRYRLKSMGLDYQLYLFNPILKKYQYVIFCIANLSENQIRIAIENHVATYGK
jgi:hypothetical protein